MAKLRLLHEQSSRETEKKLGGGVVGCTAGECHTLLRLEDPEACP